MGAVNSECESHHRMYPSAPFMHFQLPNNNFRPTLLLLGSSLHHPHSLPLLFPKCRWIAVAKLVNPVVQRKCRSMVTHSKCLGCGRCSRIAKNQLWCRSVFRTAFLIRENRIFSILYVASNFLIPNWKCSWWRHVVRFMIFVFSACQTFEETSQKLIRSMSRCRWGTIDSWLPEGAKVQEKWHYNFCQQK